MDWITLLATLGVSNCLTAIVTWFLGGKRSSSANASLIEIDAITRMKEYYRDEIDHLVNQSLTLNKLVEELKDDLAEAHEFSCTKENCPDRSKQF